MILPATAPVLRLRLFVTTCFICHVGSPFPKFSEDLARIEEESIGDASQVPVLFLQDAHASFDAQEKISQLIQDWVAQGEVKTVFAEGNRGPILTCVMESA